VAGPPTFASFDEILERTVAFNPTRSLASLRRGVLHNAHELEDGSWAWRYDHDRSGSAGTRSFVDLWDDVSAVRAPVMLVVGGESGVTDEDDRAELRRRQPDARVEVVEGAGHSIQGDRPIELARLVDDFARHTRPLGG
jgi:pimeloyl-ACP methyl ester carboxylesterase